MYRPSTTQPRGAWARHLDEQRRLRDLSQTQAFELVYERIGWSPKSRTAYVAIDKGDRQPKPDEAAVLAEEFGWPPEPQEPAPSSARTDGAGSLAEAIRELTKELQAAREERAATARRLDEVEAVLRTLVAPAMTTGAAPAPHPPTTG